MTLINVIIIVSMLYKPECIKTIKLEFFFGEQGKSRLDFRIFSWPRSSCKKECRYNINWTSQIQAIILHRESPCSLSGARDVEVPIGFGQCLLLHLGYQPTLNSTLCPILLGWGMQISTPSTENFCRRIPIEDNLVRRNKKYYKVYWHWRRRVYWLITMEITMVSHLFKCDEIGLQRFYLGQCLRIYR